MLLHARVSSQSYGDLRLKQRNITDSTFYEGRVEIYLNGEWGTVCEDNFSPIDANVVCRQLGYDGVIASPTSAFHSAYGKGEDNQPIWLDNVGCSDLNGLHILSCPNSGIGVHNCDHFSDVAVNCSPNPLEFPIRLYGHTYPSQGRLEFNCNDVWIPVCAADIDADETDTICKDLGYTMANNFERNNATNFSSILLNDLLDCVEGAKNCSCPNHAPCNEEAVIECSHTTTPFGTVRLVDKFEGILEMFINGAWRTLCADSFTQSDANAVCNKLGHLRAEELSKSILQDSQLVWNKRSDCNLSANEAFNCLAAPSLLTCSQDASVIIKCTNNSLPEEPTDEIGRSTGLPFSLETLIAICLGGGALLCFCCLFMIVCCTHLFCDYHVTNKRARPLLDGHAGTFSFTDKETKLDNEYELEKRSQHTPTFIRPIPHLIPCSTPQIPTSNSSTLDRRPANSPYPFPQEVERIKLRRSQENLLKENIPSLSLHNPTEHSDLEQLARQLEPPEELTLRHGQESWESLCLEPISEEEVSLELSEEHQALEMDFEDI